MKRGFSFFLTLAISLAALAINPTATDFSYNQCLGTHRPYPTPATIEAVPDSLTPFYINHVGRHGARFPASDKNARVLGNILAQAESEGTITPTGKSLLALVRYVEQYCNGRWGALDSLGIDEQRGLASRMYMEFPSLFDNTVVSAISSYSPRCVLSMYEFTHQLDRLNNKIEIYTSAGRQNSPTMRPFDNSPYYKDYVDSKIWETPYEDYLATCVSANPLRRILGNSFPVRREDIASLCLAEYGFLSSLPAMGIDIDLKPYFTPEEINGLWAATNLRTYLLRSTSTLSSEPSEIASSLLLDFIRTTEEAVSGTNPSTVNLRFGHAETLIPFLSLLRISGCYYLTNYFDTVAQHWQDFNIAPMAANFRMILFRGPKGTFYVRCDLNERAIPLIPNDSRLIIPWSDARNYMIKCLPLADQL